MDPMGWRQDVSVPPVAALGEPGSFRGALGRAPPEALLLENLLLSIQILTLNLTGESNLGHRQARRQPLTEKLSKVTNVSLTVRLGFTESWPWAPDNDSPGPA